jgi:predicted dithiol-disulfide oxidoreductase (DUF899 family)
MGITFSGESAEYRAARDRLLEEEIELRRAMEAVAVARRRLPPGGVVRDFPVTPTNSGLGAALRTHRPWPGSPSRRHHRAAVEPL